MTASRQREEQLAEAHAQAELSRRLQQGLLPSLSLRDPALSLRTRYQAGQERALLGADFYDALDLPDGWVALLIGDVAGHGTAEAAVGVALVTFGVRRLPALPDGGGRRADDDVFRVWQERVTAVQDRAAALLESEGVEVTDLLVAVGDSWRSAVDRVHWLEGDLLVMTSSREGPLRRIFLGSNAPRIMTRVPVPVVTLPRR